MLTIGDNVKFVDEYEVTHNGKLMEVLSDAHDDFRFFAPYRALAAGCANRLTLMVGPVVDEDGEGSQKKNGQKSD